MDSTPESTLFFKHINLILEEVYCYLFGIGNQIATYYRQEVCKYTKIVRNMKFAIENYYCYPAKIDINGQHNTQITTLSPLYLVGEALIHLC